ncbi:helix-turn-helix domain-containing protein [Streptomyces salinarius]|uniref:helix-turn-helix domain-containing protein n=1 Tax=Streptomyces salinarius TaxID=2762598 RepID=UPI0028F6F3F6|nr:helix-turn-helix domain-containing protein [Streptomyces salinarius]
MALIESGRQRIDQARNQAVVGKGDMVLYDSSRPFDSAAERCAAGAGARSALLQFPKAMLPFPARRLDRLLAVRLDARQGAGRLLAQFLAGTAKECGLCTPLVRARLGNTAVDLATAVIAQYLNSEDAVPADSRRRAQFLGITAFIEQHLGDPSLTVGEIASAHHMSTRSLHRLFQEHGHSVGAWIRDRRMGRCGHDLADPLQDHLSIGAVAARWGFGRAADFTRAFRARHGTTPSAYRRRAQGPAHGV